MTSIAAAPRRQSSTPYARRLARERDVPLAALRGSGPNGRVTADDVLRWAPPAVPPESAPAAGVPAVAPAPAPAQPVVAAFAISIATTAATALLDRLAEVQPGIVWDDLCLKAAAAAMRGVEALGADGAVVLHGGRSGAARGLGALAGLSLGAIAARRSGEGGSGEGGQAEGGLAVSFVDRPGIRPVAVPLAAGLAARLVIGSPAPDGTADVLLAYDADRLDDADAASYLAAFRALVETPLRLLV